MTFRGVALLFLKPSNRLFIYDLNKDVAVGKSSTPYNKVRLFDIRSVNELYWMKLRVFIKKEERQPNLKLCADYSKLSEPGINICVEQRNTQISSENR